jgi:hypothetical protein
MNRILRVADILEKYHPADTILNKLPNYKYNKHYVINDKLIGIITSTHLTNFKEKYSHIDEHEREDILAMNIHESFYNNYNEHDIANYFHKLIYDLPTYSHYHKNV